MKMHGASQPLLVDSSNSRRPNLFGAGLLLMPGIVWLVTLGRAAENLPASDDHYSLLPFLNNWQESSAASDFWRLLFAQYNDHRIAFVKFLVVLDFKIFGELNFFVLQVAGWIAWLLVVVGLIVMTPATRRSLWLGLPVALLLLHLEGYTNFLVALDMGNLWVVTFALFSIQCAFASRAKVFALSPIFAVMSALAFTNGLLVFPAVIFGLLLGRQFSRAAVFGSVGAILWAIYFFGYHHPAGAFSAIELLQKTAIMCGGLLQLARTPDIVTLVGGTVILAAVIALLAYPQLWRELPAHGAFLLFTLMTAVTAARGRAGWGNYYMTQDRYRLYGLLMLGILYVVLIEFRMTNRRLLAWSSIGASSLYCFLSYASYNAPLGGQQAWCRAAALNWQLDQCFANTIAQDWPMVAQALKRSHQLGTYRFPTLLNETDLVVIRELQTSKPRQQPCALEPNGSAVGYYVRPPADDSAVADFGVLVVNGRSVILPVEFLRAPVTALLAHPSGVSEHYGLILPKSEYTVSGSHPVFGLRRDANRRLATIWSGVATIP